MHETIGAGEEKKNEHPNQMLSCSFWFAQWTFQVQLSPIDIIYERQKPTHTRRFSLGVIIILKTHKQDFSAIKEEKKDVLIPHILDKKSKNLWINNQLQPKYWWPTKTF